MKTKKHFLVGMLCVAMTSALSLGIASCNEEKKPTNHGEAGMYYYDAVGDEYSLSLNDDKFILYVDGTTVNGTYSYDGTTFKAYGADKAELPATLIDGVLTIEYNGNTYRFLRKVSYVVTYETNGGSTVASANVLNGKTADKPADPTKDGYDFVGWYTDAEFTSPYSFATPVTGNVTLYARYAQNVLGANEFTAKFVVDGTATQSKATVGGVVYDLPTPEKEGATFAGWWVSDYQDGEMLTYQYTDQVLSQNTSLYAVWNSNAPIVSVTEKGAKWSAVGAGTNYTVTVYDAKGNQLATQKTTALEYEYDFSSKAAGDYTVVVATDSASTTAYYKNKALDRVSLFTVAEPSLLVFNAVENAEKYLITVTCGNDAHSHTSYDNGASTNFNFVNCEMKEGGITFVVEAVASGYASSVSAAYTYSRDLEGLTGLTYDETEGKLYWDTVEKAAYYNVAVTTAAGTDTYKVNGNSFSMKNYTGEITVKVSAVANGYNGSAAEITYTNAKLATPTGLKLNYNTLEWNKVEGATKYQVRIGAYAYDAAGTSFDLPEEFMVSGMNYDVSVQAFGATEEANSYYSDAITVNYGVFEKAGYVNGKLAWDPVGGASFYTVSVNGGAEKELSGGVSATEVTFTKAGENIVVLSAKNFLGRTLDSVEIKVAAHEIVFDSRNNAGTTTQYKAVGDKMQLPEPTYAGYDFAGWYNVPGGADNNGAKYESNTYTGNGVNILYAYWTPKSYEVELKVGTETLSTETVRYNNHYVLPVATTTDAAKTFGGWFAEENGMGRQYTNPLGESLSPWDLTEGVTLYAGWIDVLAYEEITAGDGSKAYQVSSGAGIGYVKEVTIPEEYTDPVTQETKPVIAIAASAFYDCDNLETINIPDTIQSIYIGTGGAYAAGSAFYSCNNLQNINIYCVDGSHDSTEEGARHDHETYFSSVDGVVFRHNTPQTPLENGKEIFFFPQGKVGSYTIPSGVENIPQSVFEGANIDEVIIPATVKMIGQKAFYNRSITEDGISSVIFADAQEGETEATTLTIAKEAFRSTSITEITFPARLAETDFRGLNLFYSCYDLVNINIKGSGGFYTSNSGVLCDAEGKEIVYGAPYRSGEFKVPVAVESIGANAFAGNTRLTKLVVGDNVRTIGENAFNGCTQISTVEFLGETGRLEIGASAFYGCSVLRDLVLPANLKALGEYAFGATPLLRKVTLNCGEGIEFANKVFEDKDLGIGSVSQIIIGENMDTFEINGVFSGCQINKVEIVGDNKNYKADEDGVLYSADMKRLLFYPYGQTKNYYNIPEEVEVIGAGVFEGKTNLTSITIGKNVTTIGEKAFKDAVELETVTFEGNREKELTIGASAFEGCSKVTKFEIPETTTVIGAKAFADCIKLAEIYLPESLVRIGEEGSTSVDIFAGSGSLSKVVVPTTSNYFATINGIFYGKTEGVITDLFFVPANATGAVEIPGTVKAIANKAFYQHKGITQITFGESEDGAAALTIGDYAFAETIVLEKVIFPSGLAAIPNYAFQKSSVKEVFIPNTVATIGEGAFNNASKLTKLNFEKGNDDLELTLVPSSKISSSVESAQSSYGTFYGVPAKELDIPRIRTIPGNFSYYFSYTLFEKVTLPATLQKIGDWAFANAKMKELVFDKREDGTRDLTSVYYYAFYNCDNLTSVTVPNTITSYPSTSSQFGTFVNCDKLETVTFEDGLTVIGPGMFQQSNKIKKLEIPDSVTTIGQAAFANCDGLEEVKLPAGLTKIPNNLFFTEPSSSSSDPSGNGCAKLKSITIPATVTEIGAKAFSYCTALETVTFASTSTEKLVSALEIVGDNAFAGTKVSTFVLPENASGKAITLGVSILGNCTSLTTAVIPAMVVNLNNAFSGCTALTALTYNATGTSVDETNKIIYANEGKRLVFYYGSAEELVLPTTVEEISNGAFAGKTSLKKITLPASVKIIDDYAFDGCTNLATVEGLDKTGLVKLGAYAFSKTAITSVTLPATLNKPADEAAANVIGDHAFEGCTKLQSATVNGTAMGSYMFYGCTALTTVSLNDNITHLEGWTFCGCTSLDNVTLPSKLVSVNGAEFYNCSSLTAIELPDNLVLSYKGGVSSDMSKSDDKNYNPEKVKTNGQYGLAMFRGCTSLASVKLNDSLEEIPGNMFYDCKKLTEIKLPEGLKIIGSYAFYNCSGITEFEFPESLEDIYYYSVFGNCTGLTKLDFSNTKLGQSSKSGSWLNQIGPSAFTGCSKLKELIFPAALSNIYSDGLKGITGLEKLVAPGVKEVKFTLSGATKLHTVELSPDLVSIAASAFSGCTSLKSFNFPDTLTSIGKSAFANSGIEEVDFGVGLTTIGASAFENTPLTQVYIPAGVTSIGAGAFAKCKNFTAYAVDPASVSFYAGTYGELYDSVDTLIAFPAGATGDEGYVKIDEGVLLGAEIFKGCTGITAVELPSTLRELPTGLFRESSVERVLIPTGVRSIGDYAFYGCTNLEAVDIATTVVSIGNYAFQKCTKLESLKLPTMMETIGDYAFDGCTALTSVTVPEALTTIGNMAFQGTKITSFEMYDMVTTIGGSVFKDVTTLTSTRISANVKSIGPSAFANTQIDEITLPFGLETIGSYAFQGTKIKSVTIPETVHTMGDKAVFVGSSDESYIFKDCTLLETVVFEGAPATVYPGAFEGCTALTSVTLNGEWKVIPEKMFKGCTALESITIPATVETIEKSAFLSSGLTSITVPNSVKTIEAAAFEDCKALATVTLSNTLETIGAYAFSKTAITSITIPASVKTLGSEDASGLSSSSSGGGIGGGGLIKPGIGGGLIKPGIGGGTTAAEENSNVFLDCKSLQTVVFEGAPTTMHGSTFKGCTALESVTFGGTWTAIEKNMFEGCTKLTNLTIPSTVTTIGADAFKGWTATQTIIVDKTQAEATAAWGSTWMGSASVTYKS